MYRLSDSLARKILNSINYVDIKSSGEDIFVFESLNSIGIIDATCAVGIDFPYILECPIQIFFPDIPYVPTSIPAYFLYKKIELIKPDEAWEVNRKLIDPNVDDFEEKIDVRECAVIIPSDIDKLTAPTINSIDQLLLKEPAIKDCLDLKKVRE